MRTPSARLGRGVSTLASLLALAAARPAAAEAPPKAAPAAEDAEEDPGRPPPAGKGVVWGVVTDAQSKEGLLDAQVSVVGTKQKAIADVDGRYRLVLPPGDVELRVWYELYKAKRVQNVKVTAGAVLRLDVALDRDKQSEDVVEVVVVPDRASPEALLQVRKKSTQMADAIGAADMQKSPDRNAADAAKRVVGASILGNRYVYVRGLGDRYTNSLLNGAPLPSPEPDRQAVPLDLFPAQMLSDLTVTKTFVPDMPGDFAGGSVGINLRALPEKLVVQGSLTLGVNPRATFQDALSHRGGGLDFLGLDDGTRALPKDLPAYKLVRIQPDYSVLPKEALDGWGRRFATPFATERRVLPPNGSGNVVVGNAFDLGKDVRLGLQASAGYSRRFQWFPDERVATFRPATAAQRAEAAAQGVDGAGELAVMTNRYTQQRAVDSVSWGGLAMAGLELGRNHKVTLTGLHSRAADIETRAFEGTSEERAGNVRSTRLRFNTRSLSFGQLSGEHRFPALRDATLTWTASAAYATNEDPDLREVLYNSSAGVFAWDDGAQSGSHIFLSLDEKSYSGSVAWSQPLGSLESPVRLKAGALANVKERTFRARRFGFLKPPGGDVDPSVYRLPPERLFTPDNVGTALAFQEGTFAKDNYDASLRVFSGYLMTDAQLGPKVRLVAGARLEAGRQEIVTFDPFDPSGAREATARENLDLLPAAGVVWSPLKSANVRLHYGRTLARPQLRELAPFLFTDYFGGRAIQGNTQLKRTSVDNADLRFEWFPGSGEVVAVSTFVKRFQDPIEPIIKPGSNLGTLTFENARGALAAGLEVELRKDLGFLHPSIKGLAVLGNVTVVRSEVDLDPVAAAFQTSKKRPLAGQSPYVVNAGLDWTYEKTGTRARLLYNVSGPRILQVGTNGLPDAWELPRHLLDLAVLQSLGKHVELRFTAENVLDWPVQVVQGSARREVVLDPNGQRLTESNETLSYRPGPVLSLTVALSH